ncbi:MAG: tetratricopeptide repeat protein [Acidobacteria bacterium]|nr:tetratricopeptide repeat protein [Acidobacteriota bacterium]
MASFQHRPRNAREADEQARILFSFAQFEGALAVLAQAQETNEVAELRRACYHHLAHWALETGDLARAEWAAEQLLREDNSSFQTWQTWQAWEVRGEVASLRGDDMAALECFNYALNALPREYAASPDQAREIARLLYLRVAAMVRLRRYAEAIEHWRTAVERDGDNADLWYLGALCWAQSGRTDEALRLCLRALSLDTRHLDAGKLKRQLMQNS